MRWKAAAVLFVVIILCGCLKTGSSMDQAIAMREKILSSNGCSFGANITADYGEQLYNFSLDCICDKDGNLTFSVTNPTSIAGITGKISSAGGNLTFDDKVIAFQTIADGQITPVTAPWLFMKTLRGGYLNGCATTSDGYVISIDDSYKEDALRLNITIRNDSPVFGEIYWKGRRILTITVENFTYL